LKKETLLIILVCLLLTTGAYFFIVTKKEKDAKKAGNGEVNPDVNYGSEPNQYPTGGTATQPIIQPNVHNPGTYANQGPVSQPVQAKPINTLLVKFLQIAANLKVDGVYGPKSQAAAQQLGIDVTNAKSVSDKLILPSGAGHSKFFNLQKGTKNNYVKGLQVMLGLTPDGAFGVKTEAALINAIGSPICYQKTFTDMFDKLTGLVTTWGSDGTKKISGITFNPLTWTDANIINGIKKLF
jgi:hypothetical protein